MIDRYFDMGRASRDGLETTFVDSTTMFTATRALASESLHVNHCVVPSRRGRAPSDGSCVAVKPVNNRGFGEELCVRRSSTCAAFPDASAACSAVIEFTKNSSPGLAPAAAANTAVFTAGFNVLRLGLTLAGIAHSWFLGTVRIVALKIHVYNDSSIIFTRMSPERWGVMTNADTSECAQRGS